MGWWALNKPWETGEASFLGNLFAVCIVLNLVMTEAIGIPVALYNTQGIAHEYFHDGQNGWRRRFCLRVLIILARHAIGFGIGDFIAMSSLTSALFCLRV